MNDQKPELIGRSFIRACVAAGFDIKKLRRKIHKEYPVGTLQRIAGKMWVKPVRGGESIRGLNKKEMPLLYWDQKTCKFAPAKDDPYKIMWPETGPHLEGTLVRFQYLCEDGIWDQYYGWISLRAKTRMMLQGPIGIMWGLDGLGTE